MRAARVRVLVAAVAAFLLVMGATAAWLSRPEPAGSWSPAHGLEWIVEDQLLSVEGSEGRIDVAEVRGILDRIPSSTTTLDGYDRDAFGEPWTDTDGNGCDTRNDVLRRDLTDVVTASGSWCKVATGVLDDPYTGATIDFQRGEQTSALVQIDHIVPLAWAWRQGAGAWTPEERVRFANDPVELIAVDGAANNAKADRGPAGWLPPDPGSRCEYVAVFTLVVAQHQLTLDAPDRAAITAVLDSCP